MTVSYCELELVLVAVSDLVVAYAVAECSASHCGKTQVQQENLKKSVLLALAYFDFFRVLAFRVVLLPHLLIERDHLQRSNVQIQQSEHPSPFLVALLYQLRVFALVVSAAVPLLTRCYQALVDN